jgi:hypothetical protein
MKLLVLLLLFCAMPTNVSSAQSSPPQPNHQVAKSQVTTKRQLSPEEKLWCPVLESALRGADTAEPQMRSYLLDAVAGGLGKCAPKKARDALVDSFIATLAIPETQEEVEQRERRFFRNREQPDEATQESRFNVQMKKTLQRSSLRHLLTIDEVKVDSLLPQAEPDVRSGLMDQMISQATSTKKFDRALELLSRTPSKEWFPQMFPFREATQLMLELPPDREKDKQEIFRVAMAADRERRWFTTSGDDLADMIVRFWRHIPPAIVVEAIHQVLDRANFAEEGLTLNSASGKMGFSNEHDYRVFELLPILKELDLDEADKLLQSSQQAQLHLKQFPNGIQSLDPSLGDSVPKEDEPPHKTWISTPELDRGVSNQTDQGLNAANARVREIVRTAEDNPRQAIAAAATLPETVGSHDWPFEFPRVEAYLGIAHALMKKNPSVAGDALEEMAESLKHMAPHPYQTMGQWLEGIAIARKMDQTDLALNLFRSGMEQADRLRNQDNDPDDPNTAIKAFWPSVCAYSGLVLNVAQISPQTALQRIQEIKDPEILLMLEVKLANKQLGARDFQSSAMVHKRSSHYEMFGGCAN